MDTSDTVCNEDLVKAVTVSQYCIVCVYFACTCMRTCILYSEM